MITTTLSAKQGDIAFTASAGVTGGTGIGVTYNLSDRLSFTWNAMIVQELFSEDNNSFYITGGALKFDIVPSNNITLYTFLGATIIPDETLWIGSLGLGFRNHSDKHIYTGFEIGMGLYHNRYKTRIAPTFGIIWGYIF